MIPPYHVAKPGLTRRPACVGTGGEISIGFDCGARIHGFRQQADASSATVSPYGIW